MGIRHVKVWLIALITAIATGARADVPEQDNPDHRALSGRW